MEYQADVKRYETMQYNRCGNSGLKLPAVSLGLWHNFGSTGVYENMRRICFTAFDHGITHFDLANNYGPEPGSAEQNFGMILREELHAYRDELIVSTKEIPDCQSGSESFPHGVGLCGSLLPSPYGSGDAPGGNHGSPGFDCAKRKSPVCGNFQL